MVELATTWSFPTEIIFGVGRIAALGDFCKTHNIRAPLVVCDPGIANLPIVERAMGILHDAQLSPAMFYDIQPNPTAENIDAGMAVMQQGQHDGIIAFGGGSAMDAGKVIAFMRGQTRPIWDFEDIGDWWKRADESNIAPIICVPTTAGTGSEVGRAGVIINTQTRTKKVIFHPKMLAKTVILDPELTKDLPPSITAGTGMDALAHCLEAYCAPGFHPMCEGIAVEGMRLVLGALEDAYHDGHAIQARAHMQVAASMGAVAFQKGLGGIHALSHPVGSLYNTHHGMTNATFMPYVLLHNQQAICDKIDRLAAWLGITGGFFGFVDHIMALRTALSIPHSLEDLGVDDQQFTQIASMAVVDPTASGNPLPLDEAACIGLLEKSFTGNVS
ncbi:MAG: iron-containing alcohol dehydrogenase [Pseudomonadota bacterium]